MTSWLFEKNNATLAWRLELSLLTPHIFTFGFSWTTKKLVGGFLKSQEKEMACPCSV